MRALQTRMAQGTVVSRPHSSPLMKLAIRPNSKPMGATGALLVSTGLLPVRLVDSAGTVLARLSAGHPEVVSLPATASARGQVLAVPDLGPAMQIALVVAALVPALVVCLVGLPRRDDVTA